ncbi:hypothetical protein [Nocardia seriolae]|nr:hypothetical protein [Nocardia seriolae]MTJ61661.1 hypothetical protein [Nocardia seriolae]MTJ75596.1 hypothetical protein [Nocardia seriolae]MTJ86678.1 hypothetical protein [Nocardia seriolae]MTK30673.1 hypothetical protein [Nocardia seriolae]MTK39628.1 hypothetical protein [Nocardia seriolae]
MKIALGTVGLIAAGLFLSAPNASADVQLQPIDIGVTGSGAGVTGSGTGSGTGTCGGGPTAGISFGSVGVGSSVGGPYLDFGSVCVPLG